MRKRIAACGLALALLLAVPSGARLAENGLGPGRGPAAQSGAAEAPPRTRPAYAIAMHGDLKYPPEFAHFDYVDPGAPKGGTLRQGAEGTFDSFNPFVVKGNSVNLEALLYDTLLTASADEPFSQYGRLAESVETPADRSWVIFTLREGARWHDGVPISADDLIWTFQTLLKEGQPFYRYYYGSVDRVEKLDERRVKFSFKPGENRELPLILGQISVLPKHYWEAEGRHFADATLQPPLGSGPYKIGRFEAGRFVEYERVADYWGKDLPVARGHYNFDRLRVDFFRDDTVGLEAFKHGDLDLRLEASAKNWANAYNVPEVRDGRMVKELIGNDQTEGMQGFAFNLRRKLFQDRQVRRALGYAFDFEWSNETLFYGQYKRTRSYFDNSELAARGTPAADELALLQPYRGQLPAEVFSEEYQPPSTGPGHGLRDNLWTALQILRAAGYEFRDGALRDAQGAPLAFEILLVQPSFERIVLPFIKNLARIGVQARVRTVDESQYVQRLRAYDFDMIVANFPQSRSPGNEQRDFWGSASGQQPGGRNRIGIADPVVDALIEKLIAAPDRQGLIACTRALDRVLQWGYYVIPQWHLSGDRVAYWNKLGRPAISPSSGFAPMTWWQAREQAVPGGAPPRAAQR